MSELDNQYEQLHRVYYRPNKLKALPQYLQYFVLMSDAYHNHNLSLEDELFKLTRVHRDNPRELLLISAVMKMCGYRCIWSSGLTREERKNLVTYHNGFAQYCDRKKTEMVSGN